MILSVYKRLLKVVILQRWPNKNTVLQAKDLKSGIPTGKSPWELTAGWYNTKQTI